MHQHHKRNPTKEKNQYVTYKMSSISLSFLTKNANNSTKWLEDETQTWLIVLKIAENNKVIANFMVTS